MLAQFFNLYLSTLIFVITIFVYTIFVMTVIKNNEERFIITVTMKLGRKLQEVINDSLRPYQLSMQQFNILRILRGQKEKPANLSTIQDRMIAPMSNTTRLIDKLLDKELVDRRICPSNRRKIEVTITEKGLSLLQILDPIVVTKEKEITAVLTDEEKVNFCQLLEKFSGQEK